MAKYLVTFQKFSDAACTSVFEAEADSEWDANKQAFVHYDDSWCWCFTESEERMLQDLAFGELMLSMDDAPYFAC